MSEAVCQACRAGRSDPSWVSSAGRCAPPARGLNRPSVFSLISPFGGWSPIPDRITMAGRMGFSGPRPAFFSVRSKLLDLAIRQVAARGAGLCHRRLLTCCAG